MSTDADFNTLVSGLDYPMFIVTTAAHGQRAGCLVGFATQASIDPPRLMVLLSKANSTYRVAQDADTLAVHFLHETNHALASLFGEQTGDEVDKFAACDWQEGPDQVPVLRGSRGWIVGRIRSRIDGGDHVGHLLDVIAARTDLPGDPMMFRTVRDLDPGHPA
jgi:flavin reductase (DIM6/NTAB) family NADH-FMN oxidoreductase RutF